MHYVATRMGIVVLCLQLSAFYVIMFATSGVLCSQRYPFGSVSRRGHRPRHARDHWNHRTGPAVHLRYEESLDRLSWVPRPPIDEPYQYEHPVVFSNHRTPRIETPDDGAVEESSPLDLEGSLPERRTNQRSSTHDPDAEYIGRVSYDFQKPQNSFEDGHSGNRGQWAANHKYQTEISPPTHHTDNVRPFKPPTNAAVPGSHRWAPGRRKPPPGWEVITFQVNDGNRTINVRRFVRRPAGASGGPHSTRPPTNFLVMRPPHNATVAANEEPGGDLQAAETLGFPSWGGSGSATDLPHATKSKLAKFLSLFTVIRFANTPCPTADGVPGTCFHRLECISMGGIASGTCARGYGVCCLFQLSCGGRTAQNCSYFVNPGWPSASAMASAMNCEISVEKLAGVTQVRLDLLTFELSQPTNGMCIEEQFVVSGQNINSVVPILCGANTGQHVYADVDAVRGPLRFAVLGGAGASYRIKVTQLRDGDARSAPRGCTQYLQGVRGTLRSFNYAGGSYTNDLNYAICIRKETGYCSITYSVRSTNASDTSFQLINVDEDGESLVPLGQAGAEAFNCPDDYIVIAGVRLCGDRFNDASMQIDFTENAPVTDNTNGPFIVTVRTNGNTVGRGFELDYQQNPCRSL